MDPKLAAIETRKIQAELAEAKAVVAARDRSTERVAPLTGPQVRAAIGSAGDLVQLLHAADRPDRAALHRALGARLRYTKKGSNRA